VIDEFLKSWPLFHNTYVAGWLIAILLSTIGVLSVARDQIFIGAAVTEASTLGIAVGMGLTSLLTHVPPCFEGDAFHRAMAVAFSIAATLLTVSWRRTARESHEAVTGWVFLLGGAGSILFVAHSAHGLEEIHRVLASSLIGATGLDVWIFGTLAVAAAVLLRLGYRPILLTSMDEPTASAIGVRTRLWSFGVATFLGLAVGLSIGVSGTLYTFGCLVLPPLAAKNVCRTVGPMFWVSPVVALACGVVSFVVANAGDYPPGQMSVALMCAAVLGAWIFRAFRKS
jgi:ABC-type Mn2+/Zn2+ transport system permease subunit